VTEPAAVEPVSPATAVPSRAVAADDGFLDLYQRRFREMVRMAYLLTGSVETAQDIVQDAFVRMHGRWSSVREPDAYLRAAVVNGCRSYHRRRVAERRAVGREVAGDAVAADELADVLVTLPHRQRAAIVLRYYHDLPDRDIARVLGCRVGTVASLVHRALARLREVLPRD
jgi:RNA polymerase sigma-70 factor (sigma-E family)